MNLTDCLRAELQRLGSTSHPIARTLPGIVAESQCRTRRIIALALCAAFLLGFLACYGWQGVKLEVLSSNVEEWRKIAETEWRTHHETVKMGKAAAQVMTTQIEKRKER